MTIPASSWMFAPEGEWHIRLFAAARLKFEANAWNAQNVRSAFWRFYFNSSQGHELDLGGTRFVIPERTPVLVPAGTPFSCLSPGSTRHFYVHFDVLGPPAPALARAFPQPVALGESKSWQKRIKSVAAFLESATHGNDAVPDELHVRLELKSLVFTALGEAVTMLRDEAQSQLRRDALALSPVRAALEAVESHPETAWTNAELARLCGYSEDGFIRIFKRLSGQTPAQYALERRLNRAAQLLCFSDWPIERIAAGTGFSDRFHFSRAFASRWHETPARFRKARRV